MSRCVGHGDASFSINAPRGPASKSNDKHTLALPASGGASGSSLEQTGLALTPRRSRASRDVLRPEFGLLPTCKCSADQPGEQREREGQRGPSRAPESFLTASWGEPGWRQSACGCILVDTNPEPPSPHASPAFLFNSLFLKSSFPLSL